VRAWAARPQPFDLPVAGVRAQRADCPAIEPLDDGLRGPLDAPWVDVEATLTRWRDRWSPDNRDKVTAYFERCRQATPGFAFGLVRQLQWLAPSEPFLSRPLGTTRKQLGAADHSPAMEARVDDLLARLAPHRQAAWPFFILSLTHVPVIAGHRLISMLADVRHDDVAEALLWLVEIEVQGRAAAKAWLHGKPRVPDAVVERFLAVLTAPILDGSEPDFSALVDCLAAAIDRDQVYEAFMKHVARCPIGIICALARRDGPRTRAFLHKHLKHRVFDVRYTCAQVLVELGDPAGQPALDRINKAADREDRRNADIWGN
jgi:hypothetical protein